MKLRKRFGLLQLLEQTIKPELLNCHRHLQIWKSISGRRKSVEYAFTAVDDLAVQCLTGGGV